MGDSHPAGGDPLADLATVNAQLGRLGVDPVATVDEAAALWEPDTWADLVDCSRGRLRAAVRALRGIV